MAKAIKDVTVTWTWTGDTEALIGFNVALCESGQTPTQQSVIQAWVPKSSVNSYVFQNLTLDIGQAYTSYVQACYETKDSDWVANTGGVVSDNGSSTIGTALDIGTAQASATAAMSQLSDMANDSILTPQELPALRREWDEIVGDKTKFAALTIPPAASGDYNVYTAAATGLGTYLNNGTNFSTFTVGTYPSWLNAVVDTAIVAATFRDKFKTYYDSKLALINRLTTLAATTATWATVTGAGRPADNATANIYRGAWSAAYGNYILGDEVLYNGSSYACILAHASNASYPPTNVIYWGLRASIGNPGASGAPGATGINASSAILSNETHSLPALYDGSIISYVGSGTEIRVYDGTTLLTYDAVGTTNGTYRITTTPTNITPGAITGTGTTVATIGVHSGLAAGNDTANIVYTMIGKNLSGSAISITKSQTFTKSKAGAAGVNAITAILSNTTALIPTLSDGTGGVYTGCNTTMSIFNGSVDDSANWTVTASPSAPVSGNLVTRTYTVTSLGADSGYVDLTASRSGYASITARFFVSKAKQGLIGSAVTLYWIDSPVRTIAKSQVGDYTPTTITLSAKSQTGTGAISAYAGRFMIATSPDGSTYSNTYTSATNESSFVYTVPANIKTIRIRLYQAGGTTNLLDEEVLTVVVDGANGVDGKDSAINYATAELWTASAQGTNLSGIGKFGTDFYVNGDANYRLWGSDPFGRPALLWRTANNDVANDDDGGWNKGITGLDPNKSYMSIVYFRRNSSSTNGTFYHGCGPNETSNLADGTLNSNPYFMAINIGTFTQGEWYVSVGIIHANNTTATTNSNVGGVYRMVDGSRFLGNTDFKMAPGATTQTHRTYLYYSTDPAAQIDWWSPGFYEINGNEPKVWQLIGLGGPTVQITGNRPFSFTATDGALDGAQADITFNANPRNITNPTFLWTFSGFQNAPANSGGQTQTITAAQFGTSTSATVTCTVNGYYADSVTIVRLEKTTAAPNATASYTGTAPPTGSNFKVGTAYYSTNTNDYGSVYYWTGATWTLASDRTTTTMANGFITTGVLEVGPGAYGAGNAGISGNGVEITRSGGPSSSWSESVRGSYAYTSNAYLSFIPKSNVVTEYMVGLNSDPQTNNSYDSLDYAFYFAYNNTQINVYESGVPTYSLGAYSTGDKFEIEYSGTSVKYYVTHIATGVRTLLRTSTTTTSRTFYFDTSFAELNASIKNVTVGASVNSNSSLSAYAKTPGMTVTNPVRFWAGQSFANKDIAPFRVTEDGTLVALDANIQGSIKQYSADGSYSELRDGVMKFTTSGGATYNYANRIVAGFASNGSYITLNPPFKSIPKIILSPKDTVTYTPTIGAASEQKLSLFTGNVSPSGFYIYGRLFSATGASYNRTAQLENVAANTTPLEYISATTTTWNGMSKTWICGANGQSINGDIRINFYFWQNKTAVGDVTLLGYTQDYQEGSGGDQADYYTTQSIWANVTEVAVNIWKTVIPISIYVIYDVTRPGVGDARWSLIKTETIVHNDLTGSFTLPPNTGIDPFLGANCGMNPYSDIYLSSANYAWFKIVTGPIVSTSQPITVRISNANIFECEWYETDNLGCWGTWGFPATYPAVPTISGTYQTTNPTAVTSAFAPTSLQWTDGYVSSAVTSTLNYIAIDGG